jgi:hypothetical protein
VDTASATPLKDLVDQSVVLPRRGDGSDTGVPDADGKNSFGSYPLRFSESLLISFYLNLNYA